MKLTLAEIAELRRRIDSLSPGERKLLRDLATEQPKLKPGPLPKARPKTEPKPLVMRSFNGDQQRRRKR